MPHTFRGTITNLLTLLVSPTRFAIERFQHKPIRIWNHIFRGLLAVFLVGLWLGPNVSFRNWPYYLGYVAIWFFPFSRINELALAFSRDAFQRFRDTRDTTEITPAERLKLLIGAYFEVAAQFGILYFSLLRQDFSPTLDSIIDALYFSVITITTVGYGDILPRTHWAKAVCIYELAVGFIIIAFALGAYFTTSLRAKTHQ
jgi:hypothetical protein